MPLGASGLDLPCTRLGSDLLGASGFGPWCPISLNGGLVFTINNSTSQGILSFGGWIFPIDSVADHARLKVGIRGDDPDQEFILEDLSASETHPPFRVAVVQLVSGTNFDLGSSGYVNDNAAGSCSSMDNHGRWVANAGVQRTVQRTTRVQWGIGGSAVEHLCPIATPDLDVEVDITAIFTG